MSSFSYRSMFSSKSVFLNSPLIFLQSPTQRRIEKAEILEYTVLFLQNSVAQAKKAKDVEGGEKRQFMDGFSSCLQKAASFLSDEGKAPGLEGSVTTRLCQRLTQPCVSTTIRLPVRIQNSSRKQVPDSNAQHHLQQNSVCKQGLPTACRNVVPHPNRIPFRSTDSSTLHLTAPPTSQHQTVSQTVWRPWPWEKLQTFTEKWTQNTGLV